MIRKILELTFGPDQHISNKSLFELRYIGSNVEGQECVITKLKKNNTWGTVRNYLTALGYFVKYMESKFPPMLTTEQFVSLKSALSAFKTSEKSFLSNQLLRASPDKSFF